jgi:hypothetical protein
MMIGQIIFIMSTLCMCFVIGRVVFNYISVVKPPLGDPWFWIPWTVGTVGLVVSIFVK